MIVRLVRVVWSLVLLVVGLPVFMVIGAIGGARICFAGFPLWAGLDRRNSPKKESKPWPLSVN